MSVNTLTQETVRRLTYSHILKTEIDRYRADVQDPEEWEWNSVARIVAQKISDLEIKTRTDEQLRNSGFQNGPGGKGGGGGGQHQGGGGGRGGGGGGGGKGGGGGGSPTRGKANTLAPDQKQAKRLQDAATNRA